MAAGTRWLAVGDTVMLTIDTRDTHIYPIMILISIALGITAQYILNIRRGIQKPIAGLAVLSGYFFCLTGGILLTLVMSGWREIGLSSLGGLIGMYAGNALVGAFSKRPYYSTILIQDCTLVLPLMYSVSKIGCFGAGCCRGIAYHGVWAVHYLTDTGTVTVLPVQLLETICFGLIFAAAMLLYIRRQRNAVHMVFLTGLSGKFALDFLRESHADVILSNTQILCLLLILTDVVVLIRKQMKKRSPQGI